MNCFAEERESGVPEGRLAIIHVLRMMQQKPDMLHGNSHE